MDEFRKVALMVFYDTERRILLQDRRDISKFGEEWGFFGGRLEGSETLEEGVTREVGEELTYDIQKNEYRYVGYVAIKFGGVSERHFFVSPLEDKEIRFSQKEGQGRRLYTISEARTLKMMPGDDQCLDLLEKALV